MEIIKSSTHETMIQAMKVEAMTAFVDCSVDQCPRCRISDG